jgi:hypothetical protein
VDCCRKCHARKRALGSARFRAHGVVVERVLTNNAIPYRGVLFNDALAVTGARHRYDRP